MEQTAATATEDGGSRIQNKPHQSLGTMGSNGWLVALGPDFNGTLARFFIPLPLRWATREPAMKL